MAAALAASALAADSDQDIRGAQLYKTRCAACHGANGEGKPAVKMPAVKGTAMTAEKMVELLLQGDSGTRMHATPFIDLDAPRAGAIAAFVKSLK